MPRYANMRNLKKRNPSLYDVLKQINIIYTRHKIEKIPMGTGVNIFLSGDFAIQDTHYEFSIKINKGKFNHSFLKRPKNKRLFVPSSISTIRKLLTEGEK